MRRKKMLLIDDAQVKLFQIQNSHPEWSADVQLYNAGWNAYGEWTCAKCGRMIGKNLNGDMPFWLAKEHAKECQD
jgi:hypothetical protein|tara:strand:+ start:329 stop:553 length:225 start_codon:yes stop_codon:yes gene_type:complete